MFWMEHLDEMSHLRDSVRLRAYGQKDPLAEYKNEGIKLFQRLLSAIQTSFVGSIYKVEMVSQSTADARERKAIRAGQPVASGPSFAKASEGKKHEPGRNDPCPCGATKEDGTPKKYKHCCGK